MNNQPVPKNQLLHVQKSSDVRKQKPERDPFKHQFAGLVKAGEYLLECSACGLPLLTILVTEPKIKHEFQYRADCPHCGDHSWFAKIKGGVHIGATDHVIWTNTDMEDDKVYLRTAKGEVAPHHEVEKPGVENATRSV